MKEKKLSYRFFNPNTEEETADFLLTLFAEVNEPRAEDAIRRAIQGRSDGHKQDRPSEEGIRTCAT